MHILVPVPVNPHAPASVFGQVCPRVQVRKSGCRSMSLAWRSTALSACALWAAGSVLAGPPPESLLPVRLDRVDVRLDGRIDEPVWADATLLDDLNQLSPMEGAPPAHPPRIWMVYDDEALYVAFRVDEPDPSQISSRSLERGSYYPPNHESLGTDQDAVALLLDTFNDDRSAFVFVVTPDGVRSDVQILNDGGSISDVP